jgi:putative NADH-flavin reductase
MSSILVLGATGRTGEYVVEYALAKGYSVTALVRNPAKLNWSKGVTVVEGTPESQDDIAAAIMGTDAVISALGNVRTSDMPWAKQVSPPDFMAEATRKTVKLMAANGVRRIIVVSALGVGDSWSSTPVYLRWAVKYTNLGTVYADHNKLDAEIRQADVDWTLLRAVLLTDSPEGRQTQVRFVPDKPASMRISRRHVARFAVDALADDTLIGTAPIISDAK